MQADLHECSAECAIGTTIQGQKMRDRVQMRNVNFARVPIKGVAGTEETSQIPTRCRSLREATSHILLG